MIDIPLTLSVIADVVTVLLFGLGAFGAVWLFLARRKRARIFRQAHEGFRKHHNGLRETHIMLSDRASGGIAPPTEKEYLDLIVLELLFLSSLSSFDRAIEMQEDLMAEGLF